MKTIVFIILGLAYYYFRYSNKNKGKSKGSFITEIFEQKTQPQAATYSGVDEVLDKEGYRRFILLKGKSSEEIKALLQSFHVFNEYDNITQKPIRMAESDDWKILLIDEILSNAHYYNLVMWLSEELKTKNKNCIGYALNRKRKELNFMFHPENTGYGSSVIGSFETGTTFYVDQNTTPGTVTMSSGIPFDFHEIINEIKFDGFDVSSIFYLHYDKFYIGKDR